jgi:hypothetical protein
MEEYLRTVQRRMKIKQRETQDVQPVFAQLLFTLVTQIGRLLFASSQIDQATSNS